MVLRRRLLLLHPPRRRLGESLGDDLSDERLGARYRLGRVSVYSQEACARRRAAA